MNAYLNVALKIVLCFALWAVIYHKDREGATWEYVTALLLVAGLQTVEAMS